VINRLRERMSRIDSKGEESMSFDFSKLPAKLVGWIVFAGIVALLLLILLIGGVYTMSWHDDRPFKVWEKESGFGSTKLDKTTAELKTCLQASSELQAQFSPKLHEFSKEITALREENAQLRTQLQERAAHDASIWFPVADITFTSDGGYTSSDGRHAAQGTWSSPDSELTLHLVSFDSTAVVLRTNMPPPSNNIRVDKDGLLVPMQKWEYGVTLRGIYYGEARVRVERRPKAMKRG
jgi:hypothetical protein